MVTLAGTHVNDPHYIRVFLMLLMQPSSPFTVPQQGKGHIGILSVILGCLIDPRSQHPTSEGEGGLKEITKEITKEIQSSYSTNLKCLKNGVTFIFFSLQGKEM